MPANSGLLARAPWLGGPEQDEILDWELAALAHEEDLSEAYPEDDGPGPGDDEEWLDEISYILAGPDAPSASSAPASSRASVK